MKWHLIPWVACPTWEAILPLFSTPPLPDGRDRLQGSPFQVKVKRGLEAIDPGVQSAVILAARQLFEGFRDIRPTNALHTFLAPHRRYY